MTRGAGRPRRCASRACTSPSATSRCSEASTSSSREHEVVCLIGASGSGKSTLLRCINRLEPIAAGRVVVAGEEISARGVDLDRVRRRIGIVFQAYNLFPHMSVLRNVTLAPRRGAGPVARRGRGAGDELLARFGLADKAEQYPDRLSGGQQQRVAIVRALAMQPDLLLLDEITSALDPELVAEVLDVIRGLPQVRDDDAHRHPRDGLRPRHRRPGLLPRCRPILEEGPPAAIFGRPAGGPHAPVPRPRHLGRSHGWQPSDSVAARSHRPGATTLALDR